MNNILLSTAYLPPVSYISALLHSDTALIEQWEHYQKQSYRNRCNIAAANGTMAMSIPVEHNSKEKTLTKDIRISPHGDWQRQHWKSLVSAYNTTPFFEYYADDFAPFYHSKYDFLLDFNTELLHKILELFDIDKPLNFTSEYVADYEEKAVDLRNEIHPKRTDVFQAKKYYQVFDQKNGFLPNLSCVDLLFNMGNEAILVMRDE